MLILPVITIHLKSKRNNISIKINAEKNAQLFNAMLYFYLTASYCKGCVTGCLQKRTSFNNADKQCLKDINEKKDPID